MQPKKIILFIIILFVASSAWLFNVSRKEINPNAGKNWWALYFQNPKSNDLNFVIENHSNQSNFHWEVLGKNQKTKEGTVNITKGNSQKIIVSDLDFSSSQNKKVIIQVNTKSSKKEIYKNL